MAKKKKKKLVQPYFWREIILNLHHFTNETELGLSESMSSVIEKVLLLVTTSQCVCDLVIGSSLM